MAKKKLAVAEDESAIPARGYPDLHDHLRQLEREGLLIRVKEPVDKDQEMHPLVRWQFRGGIKEKDRKAFLVRAAGGRERQAVRHSCRDRYSGGEPAHLRHRSRHRSDKSKSALGAGESESGSAGGDSIRGRARA